MDKLDDLNKCRSANAAEYIKRQTAIREIKAVKVEVRRSINDAEDALRESGPGNKKRINSVIDRLVKVEQRLFSVERELGK